MKSQSIIKRGENSVIMLLLSGFGVVKFAESGLPLLIDNLNAHSLRTTNIRISSWSPIWSFQLECSHSDTSFMVALIECLVHQPHFEICLNESCILRQLMRHQKTTYMKCTVEWGSTKGDVLSMYFFLTNTVRTHSPVWIYLLHYTTFRQKFQSFYAFFLILL